MAYSAYKTGITDSNGIIVFSELESGREYQVSEFTALLGYIKSWSGWQGVLNEDVTIDVPNTPTVSGTTLDPLSKTANASYSENISWTIDKILKMQHKRH